jgi:formate hydrogenlyase subunit 6/NADH:ubiquinone oxidoreductase subunit I
MGDPKAFLKIHRQEAGYRPVHERITDFGEVEQTLNTNDRRLQASRCMDCGIPFCHWACPVSNKQPEWQDALYRGNWKEAYEILSSTCDFPEFTGRICPAPCEKSCVLKLSSDEPVTIRENEAAIVEAAFREGYIKAEAKETGSGTLKRVLGPVSLVALGVGVIIGAGLFSITGTVAASYTGPAITLSFIIAAIGCCFAGLCYAEFASMIPVSGSAYTYSYATMGELIGLVKNRR